MKNVLVAIGVMIGLASAAPASADVLITLTTYNLPRHGVVRGHGSGSGMPVYIVPLRDAPHRSIRNGTSYEPQVKHPPRAPFVLLGHLRAYKDVFKNQAFAFRIPATLKPGLYRIYLYCRAWVAASSSAA